MILYFAGTTHSEGSATTIGFSTTTTSGFLGSSFITGFVSTTTGLTVFSVVLVVVTSVVITSFEVVPLFTVSSTIAEEPSTISVVVSIVVRSKLCGSICSVSLRVASS